MSRPQPKPCVMQMHGVDLDKTRNPAWGPVGAWKWWPWRSLNPRPGVYDFSLIDAYLAKAEIQDVPVAISPMIYLDTGQDLSPDFVKPGWPSTNGAYTYPRWNDDHPSGKDDGLGAWDSAFRSLIYEMGKRYDGDPRVHSFWGCTGRYGENIWQAGDGTTLGHNPVKFFERYVNWLDEAFEHTPVYMLSTGPTDRRRLALYMKERNVGSKHNALHFDLNNDKVYLQVPESGLVEVAKLVGPMAFEHFYSDASTGDAYLSLLKGLILNMKVFDASEKHLDTLATIKFPFGKPFWNWILEVASYPDDEVTMVYFRDTIHKYDAGDWESGWSGAFWRGSISWKSVRCVDRNSAAFKSAPIGITQNMFGAGGFGYCEASQLSVEFSVPDGWYDVVYVWSPDGVWRTDTVLVPAGPSTTLNLAPGPCWVHGVFVTPHQFTPEPEPPEPPEPATKTLEERVAALENAFSYALDLMQEFVHTVNG